jgi:hypothetical protein
MKNINDGFTDMHDHDKAFSVFDYNYKNIYTISTYIYAYIDNYNN